MYFWWIIRVDATDQLKKGLLNDIFRRHVGPLPGKQQQCTSVRIYDLGNVPMGNPFDHAVVCSNLTALNTYFPAPDDRPSRCENVPPKKGRCAKNEAVFHGGLAKSSVRRLEFA